MALVAAFAAAILLVIFAFLPLPEIVRAFAPHRLLHATVFAVFTFAWMLGLPRVSVLWIAPVILVFGFLHEVIEIVGHGHRFELRDALDNAVGTIAGALAGLAARRPRIS